jgi:hypothetical protein
LCACSALAPGEIRITGPEPGASRLRISVRIAFDSESLHELQIALHAIQPSRRRDSPFVGEQEVELAAEWRRESDSARCTRQHAREAALEARLQVDRDGRPPRAQLLTHAAQRGHGLAWVSSDPAELTARKSEELVDVGVTFEQRPRQILNQPGNPYPGNSLANGSDGGQRPEDVSHGTQPNDQHSVAGRETSGGALHREQHLSNHALGPQRGAV